MNKQDAQDAFEAAMPDFKVQKIKEYRGGFAIQAFSEDPDEGEMDPYYFVTKGGLVEGLPYLLPQHFRPIMKLFNS